MAKLNLSDACIRRALIENFDKQEIKPRAVIEELRVHNGNAIADIVALFDEAHCYEIKGSSDNIERITTQATYYNAAFRRITLVTTKCKLQRALRIAPTCWGIMLACNETEDILFRQVRKAKQNPEFTKDLALLTLWKSEMLEILQGQECQRQPTRRSCEADLRGKEKGRIEQSDLRSSICSPCVETLTEYR